MEKYKLKDDFVNGVLPNTNGKPNIIFKKGDIIDGTITEKFVFKTMMKGIMSKPTVAEARVENSDGLVFVPLSSIEKINETPSTDVAPQTFLEKNKTNLLILGGLVIAYLAYKKFNK